MKRLTLLAIALHLIWTAAFAQSQREHMVERGETITSIAKKYGISPQELIDANPDIADYFFTGLILNIPVPSRDESVNRSYYDDRDNGEYRSEQPYNRRKSDNSSPGNEFAYYYDNDGDSHMSGMEWLRQKGSNDIRFQISYDFLNKKSFARKPDFNFSNPSDFSQLSTLLSNTFKSSVYSPQYSFSFEVFFRHYFADGIFGDIGAGYNMAKGSINQITIDWQNVFNSDFEFSPSVSGAKNEYLISSIPVSLYGGYTFAFSDKVGLDVYTGPELEIGVYTERKVKDRNYKSDSITGFGWGIGTSLHISQFYLGCEYIIPCTDNLIIKGLGKTKLNTFRAYLGWMVKL